MSVRQRSAPERGTRIGAGADGVEIFADDVAVVDAVAVSSDEGGDAAEGIGGI